MHATDLHMQNLMFTHAESDVSVASTIWGILFLCEFHEHTRTCCD